MRNLSDMDDLYNFLDTCLLCKIFEKRFKIVQDIHSFNLRRCNSVSNLSGCIERELPKIIISLLTNIDVVEVFENTLTDGFICKNTRLGFDIEIFLPDYSQGDFNKMNFKKNFKAFKRQGLKTVYKLKLNGENSCSNRRVISKVLKLNENNSK